MKTLRKIMPYIVVLAVFIAVGAIGVFYFNYISDKIYEDSTGHLEEIYGQVNRAFGNFIERNWGLLDSCDGYIGLANASDFPDKDAAVKKFIDDKRKYWGFSEFYFISSDKKSVTVNGDEAEIDLGELWTDVLNEDKPILSGVTFNDGRETSVFVMPVSHNEYNSFGFDAIAVSYTNADMADSLNLDPFSGKAKCFVIHSDGSVLFSAQSGGGVFRNYLTYMTAASNLSPENIESIKSDWENQRQGLIQCEIGGVNSCILYQPVGYQDYMLLSIVPKSLISASLLSAQNKTVTVLTVIFSSLGITLAVILILRGRRLYRQNRTELMYREKMFDVLSSNVDDIFIMLDAQEHHVDYISPNIERLLGIPTEEARKDIKVIEKCAVGRNIIIAEDELESIPLNNSRYWECEYMHQTTGERRWYRMTIYHMELRNVRKFISVMSDRTQEQQMNQKLQEALDAAKSANQAKSNFLSNMSHDIRTPMNAIVGFSVLLEKDADKPEKVREYTKKITASSRHLLSLINDVLDMSKIESGKTFLNVETFSLPELLEELNIIISPQAKAKNQEFRINLQGNPPERLNGDKLRLNQILLNLLSNAVKYTPVNGKISFTVLALPHPTPQYTKLRFIVADNGIGMSEDFQKQIFMPFSREINSVTNKIQGTGLGMAITKNLVDLMGGIITVKSAMGEGSSFTVELSFQLPEPEEAERWYKNKISRILAADDEEDVRRGIKTLLRDCGIEVNCVTDGAAAVEEAVCAHTQGKDYDVILLDWKMPGLDGVETAQKIRQRIGSSVPILVLTSYDWSDIESEARLAGIDAFMPKPFFASTFWHTLKPFFDAGADTSENPESGESESKTSEIMNDKLFLVAEDNELNAEILTEMLALEGAHSELAHNGQEAVDMFLSSEPGHYDMILMDIQMPIMNGYEATKAIRSSNHPEAKTIPIAAMTANTFAEDVRNALDAGMDGHLAKPIDMNAVRELVDKCLTEDRRQTVRNQKKAENQKSDCQKTEPVREQKTDENR